LKDRRALPRHGKGTYRPVEFLRERTTEATMQPARRPSAGSAPGRWGACLAVRPHRPPSH